MMFANLLLAAPAIEQPVAHMAVATPKPCQKSVEETSEKISPKNLSRSRVSTVPGERAESSVPAGSLRARFTSTGFSELSKAFAVRENSSGPPKVTAPKQIATATNKTPKFRGNML